MNKDSNIENELAESIEEDLGIKAMAAKLAPRYSAQDAGVITDVMRGVPSAASVEMKLQAIEKLIRDIRQISASVKGMLG